MVTNSPLERRPTLDRRRITMNHSTSFPSAGNTGHYSPRACLAAIGLWIQQNKLFQPVAQMVTIRQKTLKHTPQEKLSDAFISLLAGARGLVEINKRLRAQAFPTHSLSIGKEGQSNEYRAIPPARETGKP